MKAQPFLYSVVEMQQAHYTYAYETSYKNTDNNSDNHILPPIQNLTFIILNICNNSKGDFYE